MAGSIDVEEAALLDYFINTRTPTTKFVGLSTTTPTDTGTNFTEPSGNGYARPSVPSTFWAAAVGGAPTSKITVTSILFPVATGPWGTPTHVGIFAAVSGGSPLRWGPLDVAVAVALGQQPQFNIGDLKLVHGEWNGSS